MPPESTQTHDQFEQVSSEPLRALLRKLAPARSSELDQLFDDNQIDVEVDRGIERELFQMVRGQRTIIRIGLRGTIRLQAHAYATGILMAGFNTPGFFGFTPEQRAPLFDPADQFLTWAVGTDLKRWYGTRGVEVRHETPLQLDPPDELHKLISQLDQEKWCLCEGLYRYAIGFIVFHELGHLVLRHTASTPENEKDADRFAAEWLVNAAGAPGQEMPGDRLCAMAGIAVGLLWLTVFNVFLGQSGSETHPEAYDRLYQVLDQVIDPNDDQEQIGIWWIVGQVLFFHMRTAGFEFDDKIDGPYFQGSPHDEVNYLIDRISSGDVRR